MKTFDTYKDLKKGDVVRYEDVYIHPKLSISGEGPIIGFGEFGFKTFVWVAKPEGGAAAIPYEEIIKV